MGRKEGETGGWKSDALVCSGTDEQEAQAECCISSNLEVPSLNGKASGVLQLSTSSPSVFAHLRVCCETE